MCAHSDGLSEGLGRSAWGFYLSRGGVLHGGEVYDAEISAATLRLRAAFSARNNSEEIFVLLDNLAAVLALQSGEAAYIIRLTSLLHNLATSVNVEFR